MGNYYLIGAFLLIVNLIQLSSAATNKNTYRAAVVEYSPDVSFDDDIKIIYKRSVADYANYIQEASKQNVDIIVFPEDGLSTLNVPPKRDKIYSYATKIPHPDDKVSPCNTPGYAKHLSDLSCEASASKIYVVVNLIEYVNCKGESKCPCDNAYYYNTNVVFDRNGVVIARYRKFNLFIEPGFDVTDKPDIVTFSTDFGVTFGMFICFDILFKEPALTLVREKNVHDIIYSTAWFSELPFLTAVQTQAGWAYGNDVTLLASGYNHPSNRNVGSGIYVGRAGGIQEYFPLHRANKLLVKDVPKYPFVSDNELIAKRSVSRDAKSGEPDELTLLQEDLSEYVSEIITNDFKQELCHNDLCCKFEVESAPTGDASYVYRAVAFSDARNYAHIVQAGVQVCGVVNCLNDQIASCGLRNRTFTTGRIFNNIQISGKFRKNDNTLQFPSTVNTHLLPVDPLLFTFENSEDFTAINLSDQQVDDLLTFAIYGRDYAHDSKVDQSNHADTCRLGDEL